VISLIGETFRNVEQGWAEFVNQSMTAKELEGLRSSAQRGQPYGNESWKRSIAKRLGLESTMRARGRPRKNKM